MSHKESVIMPWNSLLLSYKLCHIIKKKCLWESPLNVNETLKRLVLVQDLGLFVLTQTFSGQLPSSFTGSTKRVMWSLQSRALWMYVCTCRWNWNSGLIKVHALRGSSRRHGLSFFLPFFLVYGVLTGQTMMVQIKVRGGTALVAVPQQHTKALGQTQVLAAVRVVWHSFGLLTEFKWHPWTQYGNSYPLNFQKRTKYP